MTIQNWPYIVALLVSAIICVYVSLRSWNRREHAAAIPFTGVMLMAALWSLLYAIQLGLAPAEAAVFWTRLRYVAIVALPVFWLMFGAAFAGHSWWQEMENQALLWALPAIMLLLMVTNDSHYLFWRELSLAPNSLSRIQEVFGPAFWIHTAYAYLTLLAGTYLLLRTLLEDQGRIYQGQAAVLLAGVLTPWMVNALSIFGILPIAGGLDPTPVAFAVTGIAFTVGMHRFRLLDVVPTARVSVVNSMSDGVIVLDNNNRIVDINPAARAFLMRSDPGRHRLLGEDALEVAGPWRKTVERLLLLEELTNATVPLKSGGVTRHINVRMSPLRTGGGQLNGRVIVTSDVTAKYRAEELAKEAKAAQAASKAKSAFMANMSHELRTPLNHIIGYCELLMEDVSADGRDEYLPDLQKVHGAAKHLLSNISHVLELSRLDAGLVELDLMPYDPAKIAEDVALKMQSSAPEGGSEVSLKVQPDLQQGVGDPFKMREALLGLVRGANELSGRNSITLEVVQTGKGAEDWIDYRITNAGLTLPRQELEALFEPFTAVGGADSRSLEAGGLGLAISHRLCRLMGGTIMVEAAGNGAQLTMRLPARLTAAP